MFCHPDREESITDAGCGGRVVEVVDVVDVEVVDDVEVLVVVLLDVVVGRVVLELLEVTPSLDGLVEVVPGSAVPEVVGLLGTVELPPAGRFDAVAGGMRSEPAASMAN